MVSMLDRLPKKLILGDMTKQQFSKLREIAKHHDLVRRQLEEYIVVMNELGGVCGCDGAYDDGCYVCTPSLIGQDLRRENFKFVR